jgi:hypothetical protein
MADPNLLVLSDVHLGSTLIQHSRPEAPVRAPKTLERDRELAALLDWYAARRAGGRPWRLVIAGDLVDFVGMSVSPGGGRLATEPNDDEVRHGLGGAVDHTLEKLRLVAEHHGEVFAALARFALGVPLRGSLVTLVLVAAWMTFFGSGG